MSDRQSGNGQDRVISDHPLNPEPDSKWHVFFKDNDVLLQIDKDVRYYKMNDKSQSKKYVPQFLQ